MPEVSPVPARTPVADGRPQKTRSPQTGRTYNNHYHSYSKQNHPGTKGSGGGSSGK